MDFILMDLNGTQIYQFVYFGVATKYLSKEGEVLFDMVPIGESAIVLDPKPVEEPWMADFKTAYAKSLEPVPEPPPEG